MIFLQRPITAEHVREVCERFNEGIRVEYKSTFDDNVRGQLPKILSSFANSQGGVLIVGVRAPNGVPQAPFDGFEAQAREEYPLTVENICLRNINPPIFPQTHVVPGLAAGRTFLVVEVDQSGEAPHAIENSKMVYVLRTGNAANPYDLAEVDLIIDLVKRRNEPLARRDHLLGFAEGRSLQIVDFNRPHTQISICPVFPRNALCSAEEVWQFLVPAQFNIPRLIAPNSMKRVPDGAASFGRANPLTRLQSQYIELDKYGLLFTKRQFGIVSWAGQADQTEQLSFADLFQPLLYTMFWAHRFFDMYGYNGTIAISVLLRQVHGRAMRFVPGGEIFLDSPDDYRCQTDLVGAERIVQAEQLAAQRADILTELLAELTWAFWQSNAEFPLARLRQSVQQGLQQLGL